MRRFAFYQEVRLAHPLPENIEWRDAAGVIVGVGDAPGQPVLYGLLMPGHDHLVSCHETELAPTGRQFRRDDFYDDTQAIRVRVTNDGRGELAD